MKFIYLFNLKISSNSIEQNYPVRELYIMMKQKRQLYKQHFVYLNRTEIIIKTGRFNDTKSVTQGF